jgi:hypothetical protein
MNNISNNGENNINEIMASISIMAIISISI